MGYDITYHPIKEDEIKHWYFDVLQDETLIEKLGKQYNIDEFYVGKYKETMVVGKQTQDDEVFDKSHGYYVAIVQGLFREYFYLRGSAFSFLMEDYENFIDYTKNWEDIVDFEINTEVYDQLLENYSSGVYIPANMVIKLLEDYETDDYIKQIMNEFFSDGHIDVFLKALNYAKKHNTGLLEASEVVEPNPLDINKSISYSNLYNCDIDGVLLYQEVALEQLSKIKSDD